MSRPAVAALVAGLLAACSGSVGRQLDGRDWPDRSDGVVYPVLTFGLGP